MQQMYFKTVQKKLKVTTQGFYFYLVHLKMHSNVPIKVRWLDFALRSWVCSKPSLSAEASCQEVHFNTLPQLNNHSGWHDGNNFGSPKFGQRTRQYSIQGSTIIQLGILFHSHLSSHFCTLLFHSIMTTEPMPIIS